MDIRNKHEKIYKDAADEKLKKVGNSLADFLKTKHPEYYEKISFIVQYFDKPNQFKGYEAEIISLDEKFDLKKYFNEKIRGKDFDKFCEENNLISIILSKKSED